MLAFFTVMFCPLLAVAIATSVETNKIIVRDAGHLEFRDIHLAAFGEMTDGVFKVIRNEDGSATAERLSGLNVTDIISLEQRNAEAHDIEARGCSAGVGCDPYNLDSRDCDAAVANLQSQCGGGLAVRQGLSIYARANSVVAFWCQWKTGPYCTRDSDANANRLITDCCGLYHAGSFSDDNANSRSYSYGYIPSDRSWCA